MGTQICECFRNLARGLDFERMLRVFVVGAMHGAQLEPSISHARASEDCESNATAKI